MRRAEALQPLSRDHHQALAAALFLRRGDAQRFLDYFASEGRRHFDIEEELILPHCPPADAERVRAEHADLRARGDAVAAGERDPEQLAALGRGLDDHVRFEERDLFPRLEAALEGAELEALGAAIEAAHR